MDPPEELMATKNYSRSFRKRDRETVEKQRVGMTVRLEDKHMAK